MKITETELLEGLHGVCRDGITAISTINSEDIYWDYRQGDDGDGYNVVTEDRAEAEHILLTNGRYGRIELDVIVDPVLLAAAELHAQRCQECWGAQVEEK